MATTEQRTTTKTGTKPIRLSGPLPCKQARHQSQPRADHRSPSTFVDNSHQYTLRTSRSPSAAPVAEYQEWPFQGFLKRTKIRDDITYNLKFRLPRIPKNFYVPISADALGNGSDQELAAAAANPHNTVAHSKVQRETLQAKRKRVPWTPEKSETILKMKEEGCPWEEIHAAMPHRIPEVIQVQYSTKLKISRSGSDRFQMHRIYGDVNWPINVRSHFIVLTL